MKNRSLGNEQGRKVPGQIRHVKPTKFYVAKMPPKSTVVAAAWSPAMSMTVCRGISGSFQAMAGETSKTWTSGREGPTNGCKARRAVVSTPFEELKRYAELVRTAATTDAFATAISECISGPGASDVRQERVRNETWSAKAVTVIGELAAVGIEPSVASDAQTVGEAP